MHEVKVFDESRKSFLERQQRIHEAELQRLEEEARATRIQRRLMKEDLANEVHEGRLHVRWGWRLGGERNKSSAGQREVQEADAHVRSHPPVSSMPSARAVMRRTCSAGPRRTRSDCVECVLRQRPV